MGELEEKLNALLSNPQLMQQVANLAQNMSSGKPEQPTPPRQEQSPEQTGLDPMQIQLLLQAINQTGIDQHQQALLHALSPYLSTVRIGKLERAMRAAKLAGTASLFLNSGGLKLLAGR